VCVCVCGVTLKFSGRLKKYERENISGNKKYLMHLYVIEPIIVSTFEM
jgi:hypothetical protein